MHTTRLAVIGGGNMARAILLGAFDAGAIDPAGVVIAEPDEAKRIGFAGRGARCVESADRLAGALGPDAAILLAVKPQVFPVAAAAMGDVGDRVVISIMAGVTSGSIRAAMGGSARVVRTMPNTPAQIGMGVTAVALGAGARPGDDALARSILGSVGSVVSIDESMLDAFTAVVGSGPAYVFALAEAMFRGALAVGFDPQLADRIVRGTIEGAAGLLMTHGELSPGALRAAVTSKGGTTAAAVEALESGGFFAVVERAIVAARDRGVELGAG
jgi:pyrroline-5-carboxylate reductase